MHKAKRLPIGTVSHGCKKVAEGKWVYSKGKWKPQIKWEDFVKENFAMIQSEVEKQKKSSALIADKKLREKHYKEGIRTLRIQITNIWAGLNKSKTFSGYKLQGRINFQGLPISIENERGTMRRGEDEDGHEWATFMHIPYGYIRLTEGTDGDHVDCYIGNNHDSDRCFVVHQNDPVTGRYDEDKILLGMNNALEARRAYMRQYDRPGFFGSMDEYSMDEFKELLEKRQGVKLKKALMPIKKLVTRKGKTFPMTFWVSPKEAKAISETPEKEAEFYTPPAYKAGDTKWIMEANRIFDFAPDETITLEKVKGLQKEIFGERAGTGQIPMDHIRETAARELEWAIAQSDVGRDTGEDWYTESIARARAVLVQHIPSLAEDKEWEFFSALMAVTSPGVKVVLNMQTTISIYNIYKRTGKLPLEQPSGKKWSGLGVNLAVKKFNRMLEQKGKDGLVKWMKEESSLSELRKVNESVGFKAKSIEGEAKTVTSNARLFGPKVGPYFNNLLGDESYLTVDTWAARMFFRWTNEIKAFKNSKGLWIVDDRTGEKDKRNMKGVLDSLALEFDLSTSEMQAVLWYYEKRLYQKIKAPRPEETISYEEAARRIYEGVDTPGNGRNREGSSEAKQTALFQKADGSDGKSIEGKMKTLAGILNDTLIKSDHYGWNVVMDGHWTPFVLMEADDLIKAVTPTKKYFTSEEVKARGMCWVTIRGSRVLLQGTTGGGWVVVGGAGGRLSHLKVEKLLGKKEYARKQKERAAGQRKELRALTKEELSEQKAKRKVEVQAKRGLRAQYEEQVKNIMGVAESDLRSQITGKMMDEITDKARQIVATRKRKVLDVGDEKDIEKEKEKIVGGEIKKHIKNIERRAIDVLMNDYMKESDPNTKQALKSLLDKDKAMEILRARKEFRKSLKKIGTTPLETKQPRIKMGELLAAKSTSLDKEIIDEIAQQVETQKNIALYDRMNAQSRAITKYVDRGNASGVNGVISDVFGGGAVFSPDVFKELGIEAVARAAAIQIQQSGETDTVLKALKDFSDTKREQIVSAALSISDDRLKVADLLRNLAKGDDDDAEGMMSAAQANGYALKEMVAAQQELGTAVGSLQAMAHLINALDEPRADAVLVDMGTDLSKARDRARKAGLERGMYSIRKTRKGGKRLIMEIPRESMDRFFSINREARRQETHEDRIKKHKANTGYLPPGMNKDARHPITKKRGPIKLDAAQEAGLHFFKEKEKVILDYEAGTGKTAIAYAAVMEAIHNKGAKKVLVVTPPKLRTQFTNESGVFLDEENRKLVRNTGSMGPKKRREVYETEGVHIIGHDTLASDYGAIKEAGYDMIVIDEIHEMTPQGKGKGSQRFRGMMQLKDIPLKIVMSGTNIKNSKTELHRKIAFVDPDHALGTLATFEKRYRGLNQGTSAFQESSNDAFRKEVAPWIYTQKNHLPVKHTVNKIRVKLTSEQRKNVRELMKTYTREKAEKAIGAAARRDAELYRVVHDDAFAANSKAGKIVELMDELHTGEKAAIFVRGIQSLESTKQRIEKEFGAGTVAVIKGEGPESMPKAIEEAKAAFNDSTSKVRFIIGTKSMEAGHNLQGGTVNFHLDQRDTAADMEQREKRLHRRGQDRDVTTYILSGTNPLDLRREDIIAKKRKEMEILGNPQEVEGFDGKGFLAYLNRAEQEAGIGTPQPDRAIAG